MPVISWLIKPLMLVSAAIATWFVAEDAANFGVVQMAIAVILVTSLVALAVFWQPLVSWFRQRRD